MNIVSRQILKWREKYIDTLAKLYDYSTLLYEKNRMSEMLGSDMRYTYGSFRRKCDEISARLSRYGIGAGDRVAILSQNMPNWTVAMFSLVPFGRISVPILPDSSPTEIANILEHSECKAIFVSQRLLPKLSQECIDRMRGEPGTQVLFSVRKLRTRDTVDVKVTREKIRIPDK